MSPAAAAVLLRERDPHQPELAQLRDQLVGERLRPVELLGDRRDLGASVAAGVWVGQHPQSGGPLRLEPVGAAEDQLRPVRAR